MKAWDFEAVIYDGCIYCIGCLPDGIDIDNANVNPIFACDEWDYAPSCYECGQSHNYMNIINEEVQDV